MRWNNFWAYLSGSTLAREHETTRDLQARVRAHSAAYPHSREDREQFLTDVVAQACNVDDVYPTRSVLLALCELVDCLISFDGLMFDVPEEKNVGHLLMSEAVAWRTSLLRKERFLADRERLLPVWRGKVLVILVAILRYLPPTLFRDSWDGAQEGEAPDATIPLIDLLEGPHELLERLIITFHDDDITNAELFIEMREQFERRICLASGIDWMERATSKRAIVLPTQSRERMGERLSHLYCDGTPWLSFFRTPLPFSIPFPARFEHTHILGGSGHGKTQLLQLQIARDIQASVTDGRSVVVIDSQGDLIRTISRLKLLEPGREGSLADRVMLIDPNDVEFPVALNMFDSDRAALEGMSLLDRERMLNGTVDLYEYFFGALLGAELTNRQGIIFKYLARLLLEIPGATIHTFRQLMEDGEPFRPYMDRLPPTSRAFFRERFFDRSFNETKKQVLTRLWGVLSNTTFDRMFSHPQSKVDLFSATQEGKIVLINTAKDLLKEEGASILGRFFIALLAQTALRRAGLPAHERRPCFVYVDEAADYFDDNIGHLLNQARKYKVGMVLAHQNLDQLSPALRASVFSSTSIKYAGGVSGRDASAIAAEMHSDPDFLQAQRKHRTTTSFACYVRNVTTHAIGLTVPLGSVEAMPTMDEEAFERLREASRAGYCTPLSEVFEAPPPFASPPPPPAAAAGPERRPRSTSKVVDVEFEDSAAIPVAQSDEPAVDDTRPPEQAGRQKNADRPARRQKSAPPPPPLGGGGREHKYLQNLIREFAQSKGVHATIEERILDGAGRVDVSLKKDDVNVACEISVTNGRDYELGNIEKCLAAGYSHVLFVSGDERHLKAMEKLAIQQLEEQDRGRVSFCSPESALALIGELIGSEPTETIVRGYSVTARQADIDPEELARRRSAVAAVIAKSLRESKQD